MALEPGGRDGGTGLAGEPEWAIDGRKREEMREKNASGGRGSAHGMGIDSN